MADENRLRREQLRVWLVEEEKQMLIKNAYEHNLSQSEYIRKLIIADSIVGRQWTMDKDIGKQLLYELNRIGNNINQIAYNTNVKAFASHHDWMQLKDDYFKLLELIGKFPFLDEEGRAAWQQQIFTLLQKQ